MRYPSATIERDRSAGAFDFMELSSELSDRGFLLTSTAAMIAWGGPARST